VVLLTFGALIGLLIIAINLRSTELVEATSRTAYLGHDLIYFSAQPRVGHSGSYERHAKLFLPDHKSSRL
jgi:hypothetical protein